MSAISDPMTTADADGTVPHRGFFAGLRGLSCPAGQVVLTEESPDLESLGLQVAATLL